MQDRFMRALRRQPVDRTPVWLMRQAGRYLPEYRATRARAGDFLTLCKTPELACEVTLQPLNRYALDAAIVFSDILTIPDAMGLGLTMVEGEGPRFARPVRTAEDVNRLEAPDPETALAYVGETIRLVKRELGDRVPLIGFAGSPFTLAAYMVEGGPSRDFARLKHLLYNDTDTLHHLLDTLSTAVVEHLNAQIRAGVDVVMVFDTWGGILSTQAFTEFLDYLWAVVSGLSRSLTGDPVPCILFTKGGGQWLETLASTGCDALGLDWTVDLAGARERIGDRCVIQGNMDPACLLSSPKRIRQEVGYLLDRYGKGEGHIFNLGHGINPDTDPDHVAAMVEAVHELSAPYHAR
jgi:uroporphyrinogen decarboxylase